MLILFALTCVPIHRALAFEEPKGFRDIEFGESEESAWPKLKAMGVVKYPWSVLQHLPPPGCNDTREPQKGKRSCTMWGIKIGQTPLRYVTITFRDNRFVEAFLIFESSHFADLEAAFIQRYSSPTKIDEKPVSNLAGLQATNRVLHWHGENTRVLLTRYLSTFETGVASIALKSEVELQDELRQRQRKAGAKDL